MTLYSPGGGANLHSDLATTTNRDIGEPVVVHSMTGG